MAKSNNVVRMRRARMIPIAKLARERRLSEDIDRIPLEVAPRDGEAVRCCVYKDRTVLKYRVMPLLGYGLEDEADELTPLSQYAGRGFPVNGGVSAAAIDGIDADTARILRRLAKDPEKASNRPDGATFVEATACPGGCVGGPLAYGSAKSATRRIVAQSAGVAASR